MNDRIHAWLDGELPAEALSAEERALASRMQATLELAATAAEVRSPGLADAVMAGVAAAPAPRPRLMERLRAAIVPGPFALRPAIALAAACLIAGFGLGLWASSLGPAAPAMATAEDAPTMFVRFDLQVEGATTVQLAGSFSGWQPAHELSPSGNDHWTVTVPLTPGVHDYVFIVDGEQHVLDPAAPRIADGFGSFNNRIALIASAT